MTLMNLTTCKSRLFFFLTKTRSVTYHMNAIISRHQSILHTDCDRLNSAKDIFPTIWPAGTEKSSSSTPLVARVTHRARQKLTSHLPSPASIPRAPWAGVMASPAREVSISAGPVSTICSEPPPPASVSRERTACPAPLVFLPIFTLSQTQRRGWGVVVMEGGCRRGLGGGAAAGCCPQERQDNRGSREKYIFLSRRSQSKACHAHCTLPQFCVRGSPVFHLLRRARLLLCPSLTRTPNPPHPPFYPTLIP